MNENHYTQVQNILLHALIRVRKLTAGDIQTALLICRLTLGFHVVYTTRLSYGQMTWFTGFDRRYQIRCIQRLLEFNIVNRFDTRGESEKNKKPNYCYSLNLDSLTWNVSWGTPDGILRVKSAKKTKKRGGVYQNTNLVSNRTPIGSVLTDTKLLSNLIKNPFKFGKK